MKTSNTSTITIDNTERTISLSQDELQTLEALYYNQFSALKSECIAVLWEHDLLWNDCNIAGVKLNFNGINWFNKYYNN